MNRWSQRDMRQHCVSFRFKLYRQNVTQNDIGQRLNFQTWCANCAMTSFDDVGQLNHEIRTIQSFRKDLYGKVPMALFKVMTADQDVIHVLNEETGSFEEVEQVKVLQAPSVNGVFDISQDQINFEATSRKRFGIVFAFLHNGQFQSKYRIVSDDTGITCDPSMECIQNNDGFYTIRPQFKLSTALVIGIVPNSDCLSYITIESSANGNEHSKIVAYCIATNRVIFDGCRNVDEPIDQSEQQQPQLDVRIEQQQPEEEQEVIQVDDDSIGNIMMDYIFVSMFNAD